MDDVRVLIVADTLLARAGLAALLSQSPGLDVLGGVAIGDSLADDIEVYRPDVLVWDLGADAGPLHSLRDAMRAAPPVLLLVPDETSASAGLLGEDGGLLLRDQPASALAAAVTALSAGLHVIDPALAAQVLADDAPTTPETVEPLTAREREVLQLLAEGLANKAIAQALSISDHTVKFHVNAIMTKLNAQSRTEAVVRATRLGLIML